MSKQFKDIIAWLFILAIFLPFFLQFAFYSIEKPEKFIGWSEEFIGWSAVITFTIIIIIASYVSRRLDKNLMHWKLGFEKLFMTHRDESYNYICQALGLEYAQEIHGGENIIDDDGLRLCKKLMKTKQVITDGKLMFYILIRTSSFLSLQYQFNEARNKLEQALEIEPESTLVLIMLAEACEYAGDQEKAIEIYKSLLHLNKENKHVINYVKSQIVRVKKYGAKKPGCIGLKYMTY